MWDNTEAGQKETKMERRMD